MNNFTNHTIKKGREYIIPFVFPAAREKSTEITSQPRSFYSILSNRWVSLLGVSTRLRPLLCKELLLFFQFFSQFFRGVFLSFSCLPAGQNELLELNHALENIRTI